MMAMNDYGDWTMPALRVSAMLLSLLLAASALAQTTEWTYDVAAQSHAPTLYPNEVAPTGVVITSGAALVLLDGLGAERWKADLGRDIATPAAVADLNEDGVPEAVVALVDGAVVCLDSAGQVAWSTAFGAPAGGYKTVAIADLTASPGMEVLSGFDDGWVNCLDARGQVVWRFFGDRFRTGGGFAVADVDRDGENEVLYGTDNGHIYCLSGTGDVQWRYFELAPYGRSGINVADLEGDGKVEVLVTRSNVGNATCLMALDGASGAFLWRTKDLMQGYNSNAIVDFEGDGRFEVLHADKGNQLYCENADGSRRWTAALKGRGIFSAPCAADIDGDGAIEVMPPMRDEDPESGACTYVVGPTGVIEKALDLGGSANASPAVGDIDGDGQLELIVPADKPARIHALSWGASGRVAWPSMRGDSAMTARANAPVGKPASTKGLPQSFGEVALRFEGVRPESGEAASPDSGPLDGGPLDSGPLSALVNLGANTAWIQWKQPAPEEAFLTVTVTRAGDLSETRVVEAPPGATELRIPVHVPQGGEQRAVVSMLTSQRGSTRTAPAPIFRHAIALAPLAPAACDMPRVEQACANTVSTGQAAGVNAAVVQTRLSMLKAERDALAACATAGSLPAGEIAERATTLRRHAANLEQFAALMGAFWASSGSGDLVLWQDANPWDAFDPEAVPDQLDTAAPIAIQACGNEYENAAITMLNIGSETLHVRCMFMEPSLGQQRPQGEPEEVRRHVTLRSVVPVPAVVHERVFDALPELDLSRTIALPPGEARQLWIEVSTKGLEPGLHEWTLYLATLSKPPIVRPVPIRIEVWPVELPGDVFAKINWSSFNPSEASEQCVQDQIDHGVSVVYGPPLPVVPVDAHGNAAGSPDWSGFDGILARIPSHFTMLFSSPPPRQWPEGVDPAQDSETYFAGFRTAIQAMAAHLAERGFPYRQWAFYPIDEPWNTGFTAIPELKRFCTMVKRADPKAQNYTDPAGLVRVEYLEEFKDLIDIWQPELNILKRDPALVAWFRDNAKRFWAYEAPGPAKDWPPLGHYRAFGWFAWHFGLEGLGYWVYKGADDWWPVDIDYSAVYQTNTDVVPSRRWQADRDGVEDYRLLYLLDKEIARAREAGRNAEADAAQALIENALDSLVRWQIGQIDEITRMVRDYDMDFDRLNQYRREMVHKIIEMRGLAHS